MDSVDWMGSGSSGQLSRMEMQRARVARPANDDGPENAKRACVVTESIFTSVEGEEWCAGAATDEDAMRSAEMQSDNSRDDRAGPAHKGPVGHGGKGTRDRSELYAKLGFSP